jgi:hypothetical protein
MRAVMFVSLVLAAACEPVVHDITVRTPSSLAPDFEKVTVIVIQPVSHLRTVSLLDGHGQLIGQLSDRSHTVIKLHEGPTVLYAVHENHAESADRIEGTLVPGRTYYATIDERQGEDGLDFRALNVRSPADRWRHKDEYLAQTPRVQMDPDRVIRTANELGEPHAILRAGDAHVAKLDAAAQAERAIQETDGF